MQTDRACRRSRTARYQSAWGSAAAATGLLFDPLGEELGILLEARVSDYRGKERVALAASAESVLLAFIVLLVGLGLASVAVVQARALMSSTTVVQEVPTVEVYGVPLISYTVDLLRAKGIDNIAVVTGYGAELVEKALPAGTEIFRNPFFLATNSIASLCAMIGAREIAGSNELPEASAMRVTSLRDTLANTGSPSRSLPASSRS